MSQGFHIIVAGGGLAGCSAAISAARCGARVLLLERAAVLGGNSTRAMVGPWQSFHASVPLDKMLAAVDADALQQSSPDQYALEQRLLPPQVIGGIAQEFVDDLVARGASLGHLPDPVGFAGSLTPVDAEALTLYLAEKLAAEGVEVQLNTSFTAEHAAAVSPTGQPVQVIDATGACAAAQLMGAPVRISEQRQPLTWMFTMAPVDPAAVREYQLANRSEFVMHPAFERLRPDFLAVSGFFSQVAAARASGEFSLPRDRVLFFSTPRPGEVLVNTTRIPAEHPDPIAEGLRQVRELAAWLPRRIPGFERAEVVRIADSIGERESARLIGDYELSGNDLLTGRSFPDAVTRGCYPIDIHASTNEGLATHELNPKGFYDIPLGCLVHSGTPRLTVAGRCISADRQGFASARTLPTAMALGQAAGIIAASKAQFCEFSPESCMKAVSLV